MMISQYILDEIVNRKDKQYLDDLIQSIIETKTKILMKKKRFQSDNPLDFVSHI